MALTNLPVGAPPAPPVREKTGHLLLRGWCILLMVIALAGVGVLNVFGATVTAVGVIGATLISIVLWIVVRPPVQWRRLPWFALAYVAWAVASLIWSAWPATSALTLLLLVITTVQALFVAFVLTWREIVRALASALKWVLAVSVVFELWVSIFVGGPILPGFERPAEQLDPIVYWSRDNLFDGGRIQGIWGNANLLAAVALLAIVVFALRIAARAPGRVLLIAWIALALFLFVRAASATALVAAAAVAVVLTTVLLMRTTRRPGERTRYYLVYIAVAVGGALAIWFGRQPVLAALGRDTDLTGREAIWEAVLERANERPIVGWGYATPWLPWDPNFDRWIIDHGQTVVQAHNMWVDVYLQLGLVGIVLIGLTYLAFLWRSWFFAVDRPRWDLRADRPYSPLSLLPTLVGAMLFVQGFAESAPLLNWGWMLLVLLGAKIKQSPFVGEGPAEISVAMERGEAPRPAP